MKEVEQRGYTNITHLATGGEGDVYTCEKQGTKYIVKIVAALDDEQTDILQRVNTLRNEYFLLIIEIIQNGDKTIIIREYIEGATLAEEIKKNGAFAYHRAKEIIFDICSALHALHAMKPHPIIYRDLKPDNVIIMPNGKVKLIDFGIVRYYKQESTQDTVLAGTKGYTAPEVMAGMQSDERSDLYSIGLVFYELFSGKSLQDPPYQIRPIAENNEFVPDYVDEIIARATNINQTNRYTNIDEFVYELEHIKEIKAKQKKKKRRRTWLIALAAVIVLASAVAVTVVMLTSEKVQTLVSVDFEDENDISYISRYPDQDERVSVSGGALNVLKKGCDMEQKVLPGMLVHFRVKYSKDCAVGIGQYRINLPADFECIYHDEEQDADITTWNQRLFGVPIVNTGQWLDCVLYVNEQSSAVYAVVCDNENGSIGYIAYQIPGIFNDELLSPSLMFFGDAKDFLTVDYFNISEGSLRQYLRDNMAAYSNRRQRVDEFLAARKIAHMLCVSNVPSYLFLQVMSPMAHLVRCRKEMC